MTIKSLSNASFKVASVDIKYLQEELPIIKQRMKKIGIIVFPGTNCDRDVFHVLSDVLRVQTDYVWHNKQVLHDYAGIILPGGFSYGDRLRAGAIAAHSPIISQVKKMAGDGVPVLGICNGFQILVESGLLPGALVRNERLSFVCKWIEAEIENAKTPFTNLFEKNQRIRIPIAHGEGRYVADTHTLKRLKEKNQVVLRFVDANHNGSVESIAAICNMDGNVLGMMPHPERASEEILSPDTKSNDGSLIFRSLLRYLGEEFLA
jgi:phosphoribosylformylglycinamidine synthase subunit PurQ / glutaminase